MDKKFGTLLLGVLFTFILVGGVFAEDVSYADASSTLTNIPSDDFIGRIISSIQYAIFNGGTFTVYGDTLGCSKNPDDIKTFKGTGTFDLNQYSQPAGFVNYFRGSPNDGAYTSHPTDSRQFLKEVYLEAGKTSSISFQCDAGSYWNNECYGEIYFCPKPCYSNSDCGSNEQCDKTVLSSKIPDAGVCRTTSNGTLQIPTHKTNVYSCNNGNKTFVNSVSYGSSNFCTNPSDSKYLIGTTDQCLSSEPTICNTAVSSNILKSVSLTADEFNQAPPKLITASMCTLSSECLTRENYSVSCIFSDDIKNINKNAISALSKTEGGITAVCFGVSDSFFGLAKYLFGEDAGCVNYDYKDYTISGTCRATDSGGFFSKFAFFSITGNKNTDGMIILFGGIVLLLFALSLGGRK